MLRIGIDLGGTKIEGVVLEAGRILFRKRIPTEQEGGYEHILGRIRLLYEEMAAIAGGRPYTFGIGTPGALSRHTGLLKNSNTLCLNGRPLKADLERLLGRRVEVQNDANCFAMAEALQGAGTGKELVFGVILGTGCGGGIVMNGQVRTGPQAIAGEWGHMRIDPNGPLCYCGQRGCVETYISGGGLEARYKERFGEALSFVEIAERYRRQEADAVSFLRDFFENFGRAMANLVNILDPDVIVLGGGVSNFEAIYTEGVAAVAKHVFSDSFDTPIVKHRLGDSAGVIGAALIGV
ncbi:MAG TPA: ROK family protein [Verrucomicrobia bacterium]|nr:ROK family protein [Verrucomicrobiota bacterium]HOP95805.1 ROK family protein [Verrucomicrobiota bacterium]